MGSKMVFFSRSWYQNGTKTWFGYGLDMSKMVFFSSTDIRMGLRLGLDMGFGGDIGGIVCKEKALFW